MNKIYLKFAFFVVGILGGVVAGALAVWAVSQFVLAFNQGADPASIFYGAVLIIPKDEQVLWLPDAISTGTKPSHSQRDEVIAAYWQAWLAVSRAQLTGDTSDLSTYWAGNAFKQISVDPKHHIQQTDIGHKLNLTFFSDDGTVVAFDDHDFSLKQQVQTVTLNITVSASVVMTLDNGYWRVRILTMHYQSTAP
jgi:hypothetical protein